METWWHQNKDGSLNLEKVREVLMRHVPQGSDAHFGLDAIMARIAALAELERERDEATWREWAESRHSVQQMREELERLRAENARLIGDHAAALRLVTDVRAAIGDDGERMQPELIEYCKAMKRDAERYRTVRAWHNNDVDVAVVRAKEPIYGARLDEIVDKEIGGGNE